MEEDRYRTLDAAAEAVYKERSSKFLAFAYPVRSEAEIAAHLTALRKTYYDATHHCYAWRLGPQGEASRMNDDGEPSSTAGRPILGQLRSHEVTDCMVVVVRYFGGTKLGVSGLIDAYKTATDLVLQAAHIVERTVDSTFTVHFAYEVTNAVMRVVKEFAPRVVEQQFDNLCRMRLAIRTSRAAQLRTALLNIENVTLEEEE